MAARFRSQAPSRRACPRLGLVCQTLSQECRFRTTTRSRFLSFSTRKRHLLLTELYWDNLARLHWTLGWCRRRGIELFRVNSDLFPMSEHRVGRAVLETMRHSLSSIGRRAEALGIRVIIHPEQFVVLNSESPRVVRNSVAVLQCNANWFDLMGLPQTSWAAMNIHGGKGGRAEQLVAAVTALPPNVRDRLTLENDEHVYGAADILDICRRTGVAMIFDNHHHAVKEKLDSYEHPSVAEFTAAARATWPDPAWQVVHLSNGRDAITDARHSDLISAFPTAFAQAPWIEVEAKGKETAIAGLLRDQACLRNSPEEARRLESSYPRA